MDEMPTSSKNKRKRDAQKEKRRKAQDATSAAAERNRRAAQAAKDRALAFNPKKAKRGQRQFKGKCFYCKQEGHRESECPKKLADGKADDE